MRRKAFLVEEVTNIKKGNPELIRKLERGNGSLAIRIALYYRASDDVMKMILKAHAEAVKVENIFGWLPFHFDLRCEATDDNNRNDLYCLPKGCGNPTERWMLTLTY